MIQSGKQDLIQYRLSRARETLDEVRDPDKLGHWNGAISRLYYKVTPEFGGYLVCILSKKV